MAAIAILAAAALLTLAGPGTRNEASSLSSAGEGLMLAHSYFRSSATECRTLDDRSDWAIGEGLVLAFPASGSLSERNLLELRRRLHQGGVLLLLYSISAQSSAEKELFDRLDLSATQVSEDASLNFLRWWRKEKTPTKIKAPNLKAAVLISRPRLALSAHPEDEILLEDPENHQIFGLIRKIGKGSVFLLPSEALANQRLLRGGNLDFLEKLRTRLPPDLSFDEELHGLSKPRAMNEEERGMADALLGHLFLIYLLGLLALGRRMGPAWPTQPRALNSVSGLLLRLGAVHRRMGHHADAAAAMLRRATEYHSWTVTPPELVAEAINLRGRMLLNFSRKLAACQKEAGKHR